MEKVQFSALTVPPLSYLNFSILTKPNLYCDNSLATIVSQNDLHRFLTFQFVSMKTNTMANTNRWLCFVEGNLTA